MAATLWSLRCICSTILPSVDDTTAIMVWGRGGIGCRLVERNSELFSELMLLTELCKFGMVDCDM